MPTTAVKPSQCELCQRHVAALTKHHLIPRTVHRKRKFRKLYDRELMHTQLLWCCRPCHSFIHKCLSEQEMALRYNSREALLAVDEIKQFVNWLSKKPAGFMPKIR